MYRAYQLFTDDNLNVELIEIVLMGEGAGGRVTLVRPESKSDQSHPGPLPRFPPSYVLWSASQVGPGQRFAGSLGLKT